MAMNGSYVQLGYVTNDFEKALELVMETRAMGPFKEMRHLTIGAREGRDVTCHFGLAFKDGTHFEIIQPLSGDALFYTDALPSQAFAMRLHHMGYYYPQASDYAAAIAGAEAKWVKAIDQKIFDGGYCYFDARADFGHYIELYSFPAESHFEGVPSY